MGRTPAAAHPTAPARGTAAQRRPTDIGYHLDLLNEADNLDKVHHIHYPQPDHDDRGHSMATALMQVRAAARELGVHENTLRRWEEAGLVNAVRLPSGVRRFHAEDIEQLREQIYGSRRAADTGVQRP
jgi:hypothetical protein